MKAISVLARVAIVAAAASAAAASAFTGCPSLPATGSGLLGRGVPRSEIADLLVNELARRQSAAQAGSSGEQNTFLADIDYAAYLKIFSFVNDADVAEGIRKRLNALDPMGDLGDRFILLLADNYFRLFPVDLYRRHGLSPYAWLSGKAAIGSSYIDVLARRYGSSDPKAHWLYELIGIYALFQVASHLDSELAANRLDRATLEPTIALLQRHGVPVGLPTGDMQKAWGYFRRGEFAKLLDRVLDKTFTARYENIVGDSYSGRELPMPCDLHAVAISGLRLGPVGIAYAVDRQRVAVTYSVPGSGSSPSVPPRALIAMSASYTDTDGLPYGFTVVGGGVRNAMISRRMDALVIVGSGGLIVGDLRRGVRCGGQPLRPFESLPDYYCLLTCASGKTTSVFQTHLLYAEGQPALNPGAAPINDGKIQRRERRILAVTSDKFVVVDIPIACTLAEATFLFEKAVALLGVRPASVQAAVNLDTGTFDILDVFCPPGTRFQHKTRPLSEATNLLVLSVR
ncbi:MAG TPA: hypothetical protein VEZ11_05770 [Thermoanaerobaculia bacterium]|nr:hypothetical protein [Thermoanaerobaculia bacterium]